MKYIYSVKSGHLYNGRFEFTRTNLYSSLAKAKAEIKNVIEINKGFDIENDTFDFGGFNIKFNEQITYNCLSTDDKPMRLRLVLEKVIVE
jgi:hypothetical protein